jgi:deazaflavin-dependent oxidoreductase (nitroreductase family)
MPTRTDSLRDHLSQTNEITITVTGRKSGRAISNPVWFVVEGDALYLVPVQGSDTQWYKNVVANPAIRVGADGAQAEFRAASITDTREVESIVEKFRGKYGAGDVKKYYAKHDVALRLPLS